MCRWLAYTGSPVLLEELLYKPQHSLIAQSMHSTLGAEATNGDGFGVGWYGAQETLVRGGAAPGESAGSDQGIAFVSRSTVLRRSGHWARAFQDAVDDPRR